MKTAVSIPDPVFEGAERLARQLRKSRSQLYSEALAEYLARHSLDRVTEALDRVVEAEGGQEDEFLARASRRVLRRSAW